MNKEKDTPEEKFIDWFKDHLMSKSLAPDQGDINKGLMLLEEARQQERERINDAYDKGSAEATMVCNEKTIPRAIKQERERIIEEIEKYKEFCNELHEKAHKDNLNMILYDAHSRTIACNHILEKIKNLK